MTTPKLTEQRAAIKFCVKLNKTPSETMSMLSDANLKPPVCRALVYKWHKRFREGRESFEDDSGRERPKLVSSAMIQRVNDVVDEDRRITIGEICDRIHVSYGTIQTILTEKLCMHRICARWIPRLLSAGDKSRRVVASREFLRRYNNQGEAFLKRIITTEENWLFFYDPESKQQSSQ
ncbi:protein GVQW3-like [Mercenaria mercenaria]|uniref:protein GVQW3-like n=1 Tax=Mercenaria mercenaria TaxID=6596 RepID=UPI00234EB6ED|nr:protein GVQW3-like [Mercenaria mercenaria]